MYAPNRSRENPSFETTNTSTSRFRSTVTALGLCAVLQVAGTAPTEAAPAITVPSTSQECAPLAPADIQQAQDMLRQPLRMDMRKVIDDEALFQGVEAPQDASPINANGSTLYNDLAKSGEQRQREKVAKEYGLTVFNPLPTLDRMKQQPGVTMFGEAKVFLQRYGVSLQFSSMPVVGLSLQDVESTAIKDSLVQLVTYFGRQPREYIAQTKIAEIRFNRSLTYQGLYVPEPNHNWVALSINNNSTPEARSEVIAHEFYHGWDTNTGCGSSYAAEHDRSFEKVAPWYARRSSLTVEDYRQKVDGLVEEQQDGTKRAGDLDCEPYKKAVELGSKTRTTDGYARRANAIEEKANLARGFTSDTLHELYTDPQIWHVRDAYTHIVARSLQKDSRIAKYIYETTKPAPYAGIALPKPC